MNRDIGLDSTEMSSLAVGAGRVRCWRGTTGITFGDATFFGYWFGGGLSLGWWGESLRESWGGCWDGLLA